MLTRAPRAPVPGMPTPRLSSALSLLSVSTQNRSLSCHVGTLVSHGNLAIFSGVIHLLEANQEKVYWDRLYRNTNVTTYSYARIKEEHEWLKHGLVEYFYQPRFIQKWLDEGNKIEDHMPWIWA